MLRVMMSACCSLGLFAMVGTAQAAECSGTDFLVTELADTVLEEVRYNDSLPELATTANRVTSECGPLFEVAMEELGVPLLSQPEAVWLVLRDRIEIADGETHATKGRYDA